MWPSVADLMTVLAIFGLFSAVEMAPYFNENGELVDQISDLRRKLAEEEQNIEGMKEDLEERDKTIEGQKAEIREAAKNAELFQATQRVEAAIEEFFATESFEFEVDQSLRLGENLVRFDLNGYEPKWQGNGKNRLRTFCFALMAWFDRQTDGPASLGRSSFVLEVEGHTDSIPCSGDDYCNWRISAARAAVFVELLKNDAFCPGGNEFAMRAVGLASSSPVDAGSPRSPINRRVEITLRPNYKNILGSESVR